MKISPSLRQRFVISADDYGIRHSAEPIFLRLAREGKIDRVAVLVRYVSKEAARELIATGVKIDLHLDLIELLGRGETPGQSIMWRGLQFLTCLVEGRLGKKRVEEAWRAQIERFQILFGRLPDGLNSHEHVHYFSPFFQIVLQLARDYQIPRVRFGRAGHLFSLHFSFIGFVLSLFSLMNQKQFRMSERDTTTYMVNYDWIQRHFPHFIERLPAEGDIELVVHPERESEATFLDDEILSL